MKIAILEEVASNRHQFSKYLSSTGHTVRIAKSLSTLNPDFLRNSLLIDEESAEEILASFKNGGAGKPARFVVFTHYITSDKLNCLQKLGADAVLFYDTFLQDLERMLNLLPTYKIMARPE